MTLPDLSRYDRFAIDSETNGVDYPSRPVGISIYTPDDLGWYLRWGHERGGNNCTLEEIIAWAKVEFQRPQQTHIFFNMIFEFEQFAKAGIIPMPGLMPNCRDAATSAALLNENENAYSLDRLSEKYLDGCKETQELDEWCAAQFGGRATHKAQVANYWRAPGYMVEDYAIDDARKTMRLDDRNQTLIEAEGLQSIHGVETALLPIVANMYLFGTRVNREAAAKVNDGLREELMRMKLRWLEFTKEFAPERLVGPDDFALPSNEWCAQILNALSVPAVGKTKKGGVSVTADMLEAVEDDYEAAQVLLRLRQTTKLSGTFVQGYILDHADEHGIIHGDFHPLQVEYVPGKNYGTVSGRFSSWLHNTPGDKNPVPGRLIRSLFVPYHEDLQWVKADINQAEYRMLGHYAGGSIARKYQANPLVDFHDMLTEMINNPDLNRPKIKTVNFGKIYGAGLERGATLAGVSIEEWKRIVGLYDKEVPEVKTIFKLVKDTANRRGYITTWGGRRIRYRTRAEAIKLGWTIKNPKELHVGTFKALNNLLQGSVADLIKKIMVRVGGPGGIIDWQNTFLHLQVHDELDCSSPRGSAGTTFVKHLKDAMETWGAADGPLLRVPIIADVKAGDTWGALVKMKEKKAA